MGRALSSLRKHPLLFLYLFLLTVKSFQEVGGVRLGSLLLGVLLGLTVILGRMAPVKEHIYAACGLGLAFLVTTLVTGKDWLYLGFFYVVLLSNIAAFAYARRCRIDPEELARMFVFAQFPLVLASWLTFREQWYGGYEIQSFSDFNTFFALQLSILLPYVLVQRGFFYSLLAILTLFFLGSRAGILSIPVAYLILRRRELWKASSLKGIMIVGVLVGIAAIGANVSEAVRSLTVFYSNKFVNIGGDNEFGDGANPSDMGRMAYAYATLGHINGSNVLLGSGIKNNQNIIRETLGAAGLQDVIGESFLQGRVHNVFLELLSDVGLVGLAILATALGRALVFLWHERLDVHLASIVIFILQYNVESNYISFFFVFMVFYYLYVVSWYARSNHRKTVQRRGLAQVNSR